MVCAHDWRVIWTQNESEIYQNLVCMNRMNRIDSLTLRWSVQNCSELFRAVRRAPTAIPSTHKRVSLRKLRRTLGIDSKVGLTLTQLVFDVRKVDYEMR